jgi:hypothetical protein
MSFATPPSSMNRATHVPGRMTAVMQSMVSSNTLSCVMNTNSQQSVLCGGAVDAQGNTIPIINCPRLNINCGNTAVLEFNCGLNSTNTTAAFAQAARTVAAAEPAAVQDQMKKIVAKKGYSSVSDYLGSAITATCGVSQSATQTIVANLACEDAAGDIVNAINTLDATGACSVVIVSNLIQQARVDAANAAAGTKPPFMSNTVFALVCFFGAAVLGVAIGLAIIFKQAAPKVAAEPLRIELVKS